jgi:hypothetical protein
MARTGMTNLIGELRALAVAGTADYTLGTVNYWSDDQLQTVLDRHQLTVVREELHPVEQYEGGTLVYKEHRSQYGNYEATSGGTAIFEVENATGSTYGTALWSMDYARGVLTFAASTGGSSVFINGYSYDVYRAAADVWRQKAGHHAGAVDFKTDNMSINRSDLMKQDLQMATYYEGMGRVKKMSFERDDTT